MVSIPVIRVNKYMNYCSETYCKNVWGLGAELYVHRDEGGEMRCWWD